MTDTELPKVITKKPRILSPAEFWRLLACIPDRYRLLVLTEIETGLRWGELIALRPRHIDFLRRIITVEETIVEVSRKVSPTGERMIVKPYPKDDESHWPLPSWPVPSWPVPSWPVPSWPVPSGRLLCRRRTSLRRDLQPFVSSSGRRLSQTLGRAGRKRESAPAFVG